MPNDRYILPENASIYTMKRMFNELVGDLAHAGFKNLLTNPRFNMKTGTVFQGWVSNVTFTMEPDGIYYSPTGAGSFVRQKVTDLEPGTEYTAIIDLKTTADLQFRVFGATASGDIINPFDPSQVDQSFVEIPLENPPQGWRRFLVFFKTRENTMSANDVYIDVISKNAGSVWLKQAMLYQSFVEVYRIPAREHLIENTRYNGTMWELTYDGINWHPILIDDGYFIERVQDIVGGMIGAGSQQFGIVVTYDDTQGKLNFNVNDFTITVDSEAHGTVTITDLASATLHLTLDTEAVQDYVGAMVAGSQQLGISVTYNDVTGKLDFDVKDFTLTLQGEAHGSVTITNLSDAALVVTLDAKAVQDYVGAMVSGNTENGISVTYNDATGKLDFDVNDFAITLSGDVTGSGTVTNLGAVNISVQVYDDSHNHSNSTLSSIDWSKILNKPGALVSGGYNGTVFKDSRLDIVGLALALTFGGSTYYVPSMTTACGCTCTCTCQCQCNCNHSKCAKWG